MIWCSEFVDGRAATPSYPPIDDQWRDLANGDRTVTPVGRGTHNAYAVGDLFWQLASPSSGRYHVQVFTLGAGTARFWIAQAGPGAGGLNPISPAVTAK